MIKNYEIAIAKAEIVDDPLQRRVINDLQHVCDALVPRAWYKNLFAQKINGIYLHGPVGVGKTYLMDLFYQTVLENRKLRIHFHKFMQQIDSELRRLQGHKNPIKSIASKFAKSVRLLCLDEFLVNDVAHAMILCELLQELYARNVVIMMTSNTLPDELYLNGVHRDRFLPAIDLIKQHNQVVLLSEDNDYRLGRETAEKIWFNPLNQASADEMYRLFQKYNENIIGRVDNSSFQARRPAACPRDPMILLDTQACCVEKVLNGSREQVAGRRDLNCQQTLNSGEISIQNRMIPYVRLGGDSIWFEFNVICNLPRCQLDFLEISEKYSTLFISNIPKLMPNNTVEVLLLIYLIDVLYDKKIRLIASSAVPIGELYCEGPMLNVFQRTLSRLFEMQAGDYFLPK